MIDKQELRRLASWASKGGHHIYTYPRDDNNWENNCAYQVAATPEAIIALLDELDACKADAECYRQCGCDTCDGSGHLHRLDGEYYGACTSCGAYELEQARRERDQLKAELRKTQDWAERHVPLYEAVNKAAGELPEGWGIRICVEREGGGVELFDAEGREVEFPSDNERLDYTVCDALDYAMEQEEFYGRKDG